MLDRDRTSLMNFVQENAEAVRSSLRAKREQEEAEKRQRQSWKRSQQEELVYLKSNGAIEAFKDAAKILKRHWHDVELTVNKPTSERYNQVFVRLTWDYAQEYGRYTFSQSQWVGRKVELRVARNEEGQINGLKFDDKRDPFVLSREEMSAKIADSIRIAPRTDSVRKPSVGTILAKAFRNN